VSNVVHPDHCSFLDKMRLGCDSPSQMMVEGTSTIDYPLFESDFAGEEILVYRHPYFFIPQSVWNWWEEYSYYKKVQDTTQYYDRDPRYLEAVNIFESELAKRRE